MSDIFREIEDELRRENLRQLWVRYGKYVIGLVALIILVTAAYVGWRTYERHVHEAEGARYAAALTLVAEGHPAEATAAFAELAQNASGGIAALSLLQEAALKVKSGDVAGAIAVYDKLAANGSADPIFRDIATLLAARYGLDKGNPQAVVARLKPLANANSPWHGLALELTAVAELKAGDKAKALADLKLIANDNTVSAGVRQRAIALQKAIAP